MLDLLRKETTKGPELEGEIDIQHAEESRATRRRRCPAKEDNMFAIHTDKRTYVSRRRRRRERREGERGEGEGEEEINREKGFDLMPGWLAAWTGT
jgi:hypothetical protein